MEDQTKKKPPACGMGGWISTCRYLTHVGSFVSLNKSDVKHFLLFHQRVTREKHSTVFDSGLGSARNIK